MTQKSMETGTPHTSSGLLLISSPAFSHLGSIPPKYGCDGENISPPLTIQNIPEGCRSLAIIVEDPDAPAHTWVHWLAWNIPPLKQIEAGRQMEEEGLNDFGSKGYGGPCPPAGIHHYHFTVYALKELLHLIPSISAAQLRKQMQGHIMAEGRITGLYGRRK